MLGRCSPVHGPANRCVDVYLSVVEGGSEALLCIRNSSLTALVYIYICAFTPTQDGDSPSLCLHPTHFFCFVLSLRFTSSVFYMPMVVACWFVRDVLHIHTSLSIYKYMCIYVCMYEYVCICMCVYEYIYIYILRKEVESEIVLGSPGDGHCRYDEPMSPLAVLFDLQIGAHLRHSSSPCSLFYGPLCPPICAIVLPFSRMSAFSIEKGNGAIKTEKAEARLSVGLRVAPAQSKHIQEKASSDCGCVVRRSKVHRRGGRVCACV